MTKIAGGAEGKRNLHRHLDFIRRLSEDNRLHNLVTVVLIKCGDSSADVKATFFGQEGFRHLVGRLVLKAAVCLLGSPVIAAELAPVVVREPDRHHMPDHRTVQ